MNPVDYYNVRIASGEVLRDEGQAEVVDALQELFERLIESNKRKSSGYLRNFFTKRNSNETPEKGLYIWGGVGSGKTWLVDIFYNQLPIKEKMRSHFHHFMSETHEALDKLKGQRDPLEIYAEQLSEKIKVLCLDEFIVIDITDAMILAQLLKALFARGVTLVTTSNTMPDDLYENGLQRSNFLPAIDMLKMHTKVINLDSTIDYRLRYLERVKVYHSPLSEEVDKLLAEEFDQLSPEETYKGGAVHIFGRDIPIKRVADDIIWFDFMALCGPPRSQADYLELARCYHTVIISDVPILGPSLDNATRRFIYLIDEFYDRGVKLILSAAALPKSLYQGKRLTFDFKRVESRLLEMQSKAYLAMEHKP
jgi:cell division protein ZapE